MNQDCLDRYSQLTNIKTILSKDLKKIERECEKTFFCSKCRYYTGED